MDAYLAFFFGKAEELRSFAAEAMAAITQLSEGKVKRAESAAGITAVAFMTSRSRSEIHKALEPYWRREQRLWVLPVKDALLIDKAIMDWVRRQPT
jgi:hypothetical protein